VYNLINFVIASSGTLLLDAKNEMFDRGTLMMRIGTNEKALFRIWPVGVL